MNPALRHAELRYQVAHSDAVLVTAIAQRVADLEAVAADCPGTPGVATGTAGEATILLAQVPLGMA